MKEALSWCTVLACIGIMCLIHRKKKYYERGKEGAVIAEKTSKARGPLLISSIYVQWEWTVWNSALLVRNWAQRRHFFPLKGPGSEIDLLPPPPPPLILKKWRILRAVTTGPLLYFFSPGGGGGREVIGTILGANYWNIGIMVYWFLLPTNSLSRLKLIKVII